jgi:hypothetical protein
MAVRANHIACRDLVEDRLPFPVTEVRGDVEVLRPEVIELQDDQVGLATVDAEPLAEELEEIARPLGDKHAFSLNRVRDIPVVVP